MRLTLNEATERAENRSTGNFINEFYLRDDGDNNIVRFLLNDVSDIEVHGVHVVRMTSKNGNGYPVYVDCHGDGCPLCKEAMNHKDEKFPLVSRVRDNIYIPLICFYDDNGEVKPEYRVFVRSTNYYRNTLAGYNKRNDISKALEIERNGKKGDVRVAYNLYLANKDFDGKDITSKDSKCCELAKKTIEELKEDFDVKEDDICGRFDSLIRTWTKEQVEMFLNNPSVYPSLGGADSKEEEIKEETEVTPRNRRSTNHGF